MERFGYEDAAASKVLPTHCRWPDPFPPFSAEWIKRTKKRITERKIQPYHNSRWLLTIDRPHCWISAILSPEFLSWTHLPEHFDSQMDQFLNN